MKLKYLLRGIGIGIFAAGLIGFLVSLAGPSVSDETVIQRARELGYEKEEDILARLEETAGPVKLTDETPANAKDVETKSIVEEILPEGIKTSETSEEKTSEEVKNTEEDSAKKAAEEAEKKKAEEEAAKKAAEEAEKKKAEEEAAKKAAEEAEKKKAEEEAAKKAAEEAEKKKAEEEAAKKAAEEAEKKKAEEEAAKKAAEELEKKKAAGETVTISVQSGMYSDTVAGLCKDAGLVSDATAFDKFLCDNGYSGRISVGDHVIVKGSSQEEIAKALCR